MSIVLPPEVQTKKVKSLDGKARKLVDELLKEKFGEEVVEVHDPFPQQFANGAFGAMFQPFMDNQRRGRSPDIRVDFQPWNNRRIAKVHVYYPDEFNLVDGFRLLDRELGRSTNRRVVMGELFYREIMHDSRFAMNVKQGFKSGNFISEIFGFQLITTQNPAYAKECIIEQEF